MKILIYGKTKERAFYRLQSLLDDMRYGDVNRVRKSSFEFVVELKNGDIFHAVIASDSSRGSKWDYAYIDKNIDNKTIQQIILPCYIGLNTTGHYEFY